MYAPIRGQRLYEQVVERIEALIASGELQSGDRLPNERSLAEQFEVSRTVIREALKTLSNKGLIEVRTGQGSFVVDHSSHSFKQSLQLMMDFGGMHDPAAELVEIREIIEPELAFRAALRADHDDIAAMRKAVDEMDETTHDVIAFIRADNRFHLALAEASQNAFVPRLLDSVVDVLHELRGRIFWVEGGPQRGQAHHKRILRAIEDRAPEAAREAMRAHLDQVRRDSETARTLHPAQPDTPDEEDLHEPENT